jgi:hypothetical protein
MEGYPSDKEINHNQAMEKAGKVAEFTNTMFGIKEFAKDIGEVETSQLANDIMEKLKELESKLADIGV